MTTVQGWGLRNLTEPSDPIAVLIVEETVFVYTGTVQHRHSRTIKPFTINVHRLPDTETAFDRAAAITNKLGELGYAVDRDLRIFDYPDLRAEAVRRTGADPMEHEALFSAFEHN